MYLYFYCQFLSFQVSIQHNYCLFASNYSTLHDLKCIRDPSQNLQVVSRNLVKCKLSYQTQANKVRCHNLTSNVEKKNFWASFSFDFFLHFFLVINLLILECRVTFILHNILKNMYGLIIFAVFISRCPWFTICPAVIWKILLYVQQWYGNFFWVLCTEII